MLQEGTNVACHIDGRGKMECRGVFFFCNLLLLLKGTGDALITFSTLHYNRKL